MEQYDAWTRRHPCRAFTHRRVDALRAMRLKSERVVSILAWASEVALADSVTACRATQAVH